MQYARRLHSGKSTRVLGFVFIFGLTILILTSGFYVNYQTFEQNTAANHVSRQMQFNSTSPMICFVTRVYGAQIGYLRVLALALHYTNYDNIRMLIINTDNRTDIELLNRTIKLINELVLGADYASLLDLGMSSNGSDYGYEMTDRALTYLYDQNTQSPSMCEYVIFTNADNFYLRSFGRNISPHIQTKRDIIAWGFITRYKWPHLENTIKGQNPFIQRTIYDGSDRCLAVGLKSGEVDLGAVAYRLAFLKKHQLYFRQPDESYNPFSDGYFVEKAANLTNTSVLLRQTLFVHQ